MSATSTTHSMKKTIWTFGLIAGAILSLTMLATVPFYDSISFEKGAVIGYTSMVLAFLLVYFGIRSYRDSVGRGSISFGRGVTVGLSITVIAAVCYSATWQVVYRNFMPDFMQNYAAHQIENAKKKGKSDAELLQLKAEMDRNVKMYSNPVFNFAITCLEPLPVGVLMTLISAAILRRRKQDGDAVLAPA